MDQLDQQNDLPEQDLTTTTPEVGGQESDAPTLRDTVEKAFDTVESQAPEGETVEQKAERLRDEAGRFAAKPKTEQQQPTAPTPTTGRTAGAQQPEQDKTTLRAPQSWRPEVRSHWDALPPAVKAEVAKREMEVQRGLQETAQARSAVEAMRELIQPFMPVVQSRYNGDVAGMIQSHARTEMQLLAGTQADVAKTITDMIQHYGVGRFGKGFIETLDGALVGIEPQQSPQDLIDRAVQQRVAPLMQVIEQATSQNQQRQSQMAMESVQQFAQQAEFYEDVRTMMADMIDVAAAQGRQLGLDEAYVQACWAHPQIRGTLLQRQQQQQGQNRAQAAQRAKAAAVSVTGAPAPKPAGITQGLDRRSAVEAAFDALQDRV